MDNTYFPSLISPGKFFHVCIVKKPGWPGYAVACECTVTQTLSFGTAIFSSDFISEHGHVRTHRVILCGTNTTKHRSHALGVMLTELKYMGWISQEEINAPIH